MSSFKVNINLQAEFTSQELADFFTALAQSERGDSQPLMRILHPVEAPPPPAPVAVVEPQPQEQPVPPAPVPVAIAEAEPAPVPNRNTQWERSNITLDEDAIVEARTQAIVTGEFLSPASSISWLGIKHNPRSQHNQRIFTALRGASNRTLSFTSLGAQAGIPDKEKLKSYLREMEKQGFITAARIRI
jgi:hypothetical protein